jgi:hypothetical protein
MQNNDIHKKVEDVYREIGELGPYQLLIFVLAGVTTFIPALVGYGTSMCDCDWKTN